MPLLARQTIYSSCCALALLASSVHGLSAQEKSNAQAAPPLDAELIDFEADVMSFDADTNIVKATGRVLIRRDGYELRAGSVIYNRKTGAGEAMGAVALKTPSGDVIYAPRMTMEDGLKEAFLENFRLVFNDGAQLAAQSGERDADAGLTSLNRAVYSPCEICAGEEDPPQWQIKAVKVTHDKNKGRVYYKNATLELFGVPVIGTPFFSHPDPTVERASGFLAPEISTRRELGLRLGLPYHIPFSKSEDLTLKPILTSREFPVLAAEYRRHYGWLDYEADGSITVNDALSGGATTESITGQSELRGHISVKGEARLLDTWRSRFELNYASDDTYLRRYDFSNTDVLVSDVNLERFFDNAYISARTLAFQGLRVEDDAGLSAFALPFLTAQYTPPIKPLGGTVEFNGSFLNLVRFQGLDTLRASAAIRWRRKIVLPKGILLDTSTLVRGDIYNFSDINRPDDPAYTTGEIEDDSSTIGRGVTRLTSTLSWPLFKAMKYGSQTLEPLFQITLQPNTGQPDNLVIEDARSFELNDLNILSSERAAGLDLVEEGTRITYGLKWTYEGQAFQSDIFVGQSKRLTGIYRQFSNGVGLEGSLSDWVGRAAFRYKDFFSLEHRFRLDDTGLSFKRNEITLKVGDTKSFAKLGYFKLDRDLTFINREDREELRADTALGFAKNWRVTGSVIQDLTNGFDSIEFSTGLGYQDECIGFYFQVRRSFTEDRDVQRGTSFQVRLSLKNLGF